MGIIFLLRGSVSGRWERFLKDEESSSLLWFFLVWIMISMRFVIKGNYVFFDMRFVGKKRDLYFIIFVIVGGLYC